MTGLPTLGRARPFRQRSAVLLLMAAGFAACWLLVDVPTGFCRRPYGGGAVEYDVKSDFSHIRIRKQDSIRTLLFVGQYGDEVVESALDLNRPHYLLVPYSRTMFASYLFKRSQQRVMIVGLGGGSMVHFLRRHAPKLQIDVVEIDPAIVKVADEYFGIRAGGNLRIITADGVEHLATTPEHYDVIYMDAFLEAFAEDRWHGRADRVGDGGVSREGRRPDPCGRTGRLQPPSTRGRGRRHRRHSQRVPASLQV